MALGVVAAGRAVMWMREGVEAEAAKLVTDMDEIGERVASGRTSVKSLLLARGAKNMEGVMLEPPADAIEGVSAPHVG